LLAQQAETRLAFLCARVFVEPRAARFCGLRKYQISLVGAEPALTDCAHRPVYRRNRSEIGSDETKRRVERNQFLHFGQISSSMAEAPALFADVLPWPEKLRGDFLQMQQPLEAMDPHNRGKCRRQPRAIV